MVVDAVLHTDMSKHFQTVGEMKTLAVSNKNPDGDGILLDDAESRWKVLMFMLHLSDISGQAKPEAISQLWTERCMDEFFQQGDKEASMGLPVSYLCDRKTTKVPHSQVGFIKFVIQPAYQVLASMLKPVEEQVLPIIEHNLDVYEKESAKLDAIEEEKADDA